MQISFNDKLNTSFLVCINPVIKKDTALATEHVKRNLIKI